MIIILVRIVKGSIITLLKIEVAKILLLSIMILFLA